MRVLGHIHYFSRLSTALVALAAAAICAGALAGCPRYGIIDDGTSVSYGPANRGILINPARVPRRGHGFWSPPRWHERGLRYGTDELVAVIAHAGRHMIQGDRHAVIGVADLSRKSGGPSAWHRSHQTGRDVDLLFYSNDTQGKLLRMTAMVHFRSDGSGLLETPIAEGAQGARSPGASGPGPGMVPQIIHFDTARNWRLVRTLIENPIAKVQYIFVADWLKRLLIEHAEKSDEPKAIILAASHLMRQPGASPHDDHFHVRVYCADSDRSMGCTDYGMLRWNKKDFKYSSAPRPPAGRAATEATIGLPPLPLPVPQGLVRIPSAR